MITAMKPVFLPKTNFQLRANNEEKILASWGKIGIYALQRTARQGANLFVLHDGPPFSNGHTHLGHFLNKTLKDFVNRSKFMLGNDFCFVPGWDCHGLPIEAKVEEELKKEGISRKDIPIADFRKRCREYANGWIKIQRDEFKRYGVTADWDSLYKTMDNEFEAQIVHTFLSLLRRGYVYRGLRPVMWSVTEETALAEAEVEYKDVVSKSVYVKFPVKSSPCPSLRDTSIVIWTTTPWTLPANRAICFNEGEDYCVMKKDGDRIVIAQKLAASVPGYAAVATISGHDLCETICRHPISGYDFDVPLFHGDHVTMDIGTGFVHTAPSHGIDDFAVGKAHGLEVPEIVGENGIYIKDVPIFAGMHIFKVYPEIEKALTERGNLLSASDYKHSYPHSWRSKAPIIYRATPQWFIDLDGPLGLRNAALGEIKKVKWLPASGEKRISGMIENRPDWCISRQRVWGVPLCILINRESGEILQDEIVHDKIIKAVSEKSSDIWFSDEIWNAIGLRKEDWIKIDDIIDVWFESGTTNIAVLKNELPSEQILPTKWPADLYLEGSDQHRGWFNSSLCVSTAMFGEAPYKKVLTHGYLLYGTEKMSKSQGNVVAPADLLKKSTADALRLWVAHADYSNDIKFDLDTLKHAEDIQKRFRNTLRYMLGGLYEFDESEYIAFDKMPSLEKWVHARIFSLHQYISECLDKYKFKEAVQALHNFCAMDLSAFYFDIRKDVLYCDDATSGRRMATRTTFMHAFVYLSHWLSVFMCYGAEEAFLEFCEIFGGAVPAFLRDFIHCSYENSIHTSKFSAAPACWHDGALEKQMERIKWVRSYVTEALEVSRVNKEITSSLQASIECTVPADVVLLSDINFADICIVSTASVSHEDCAEPIVIVKKASGEKCQRCWKILTGLDSELMLCERCK